MTDEERLKSRPLLVVPKSTAVSKDWFWKCLDTPSFLGLVEIARIP
jgi:hypothetical protein